MFNFIRNSLIILLCILSSLLGLLLIRKIYLKIRQRFPITVNCWFCNSWITVSYDEKDCFECVKCLQYNGFNKEGDYNKIIPAQYDLSLNKTTQIPKSNKTAKNGLCLLCNNNQQLKIFQLAHFVPLKEENYDIEIEHFQKQLEKSYKLCKKCDKVLMTTLNKQNSWIFGNHIKNLGKRGLSLFDSLNRKSKNTIIKKQGFIIRFIKLIIIFIALLLIIKNLSTKFNSFIDLLRKYTPTDNTVVIFLKPYFIVLEDGLNGLLKIVEQDKINIWLLKLHSKKLPAVLSCLGFFLQFVLMVFDSTIQTTVKVNQFLCWIILLLTTTININKQFAIYIYLLQLFSAIYTIYGMFTRQSIATNHNNKKDKFVLKRKLIRKFVKNLETTVTDYSEQFDDDNSSHRSSSTPEIFHQSDTYLTTNTYSNFKENLNRQETTRLLSTNNSEVFNESFNTAKIDNNNSVNSTFCDDKQDLYKSLDNLHLSNSKERLIKRPKPVLSPSRFTQNSWVAGGFWRNQQNDLNFQTVNQRFNNLSRSSSQSSGFESNDNFPLPPNANQTFGYFPQKANSIMSEPVYHHHNHSVNGQYQNICGCASTESNLSSRQLYYRSDNNYYPIDNRSLFLLSGNSSNSNCLQNSFLMTKSGLFLDNDVQSNKREGLFKFDKINSISNQNVMFK